MFEPGQVIPKGTAVFVESWENDGDDYLTTRHYNFPREHINSLLHILKRFAANEDDLGNEEIDDSVLAEVLLTAYHEGNVTKDFLEDIMDITVPIPRAGCTDEEFNTFCDDADPYSAFVKFIGSPVQYDWGWCRCVSNVQILEIEEEITIPVLPLAVWEISAENQKRANGTWVNNYPIDSWEF